MSERAAGLREKLTAVESNRESRLSFVERFATADAEGRAALVRGQRLVDRAGRRGSLRGLSPDDTRLTVETLNALGAAKLDGLGGVRADALKRKLLNEFAGGDVLGPADRKEEADLRRQLADVFTTGEDAQRELVSRQERLQGSFFATLSGQHASFLSELQSALARAAVAEADVRLGEAGRKLGDLRGQAAAASLLEQAGVRSDEQFTRLRDRKQDVAAFAVAEQAVARLEAARKAVVGRLRDPAGFAGFDLPDDEADFGFFGGNRQGPGEGKLGRETVERAGRFLNEKFSDLLTPEQVGRALPRFQTEGYESARAAFSAARKEGGDTNEAVRGSLRRSLLGAVVAELGKESQGHVNDRLRAAERLAPVGLDPAGFGKAVGSGGGAAFIRALESFADPTSPLSTFRTRLATAAREFDGLSASVKALRASVEAPARSAAGAVIGGAAFLPPKPPVAPVMLAAGGPVLTPRGTDTVPAMLTPGEFVVSRDAARHNLPLLDKLNRERRPLYLAAGGPVERLPRPRPVGPERLPPPTPLYDPYAVPRPQFDFRTVLGRFAADPFGGPLALGATADLGGDVLDAFQAGQLRSLAYQQLILRAATEDDAAFSGIQAGAVGDQRQTNARLFRARHPDLLRAGERGVSHDFASTARGAATRTALTRTLAQLRPAPGPDPRERYARERARERMEESSVRRLERQSHTGREFAPLGPPRRFAAGGFVHGAGTGDTVPALLTPGEFVLNRAAAQSIGPQALALANRGGPPPPAIDPRLMNDITQAAVEFAKAVNAFSAPVGVFRGAVDGFNAGVEKFASAVDRFPTDVDHTHKVTAEVVVNGGEAWAAVNDQFRDMMTTYVTAAINREFELRLPDAPKPNRGEV